MSSLSKFTVFDVETANSRRGSLCSIGVVRIENGETLFAEDILINPELPFSRHNIAIHRITPHMVADAPAFPAVWRRIREYFVDTIVVAHCAKTMDLPALCGALERYGIDDCELPFTYICTCEVARKNRCQERFGCNKLNALCNGFGIPLENHHDALCDASACCDLLYALSDRFGIKKSDIKPYRYIRRPTELYGEEW